MNKIIVVGLLFLTSCTKSVNCMHIHANGATLEICSENVKCIGSLESIGTTKLCQYTEQNQEVEK